VDGRLQVEHRPHVGPRGGDDLVRVRVRVRVRVKVRVRVRDRVRVRVRGGDDRDGAEHDGVGDQRATHAEGAQHEGGAEEREGEGDAGEG